MLGDRGTRAAAETNRIIEREMGYVLPRRP
jgi:hypothetical protein